MSQEYRVFAKFVRRVQRRLYQRRLLQGGVLIGTVALALLLLGVAVQPLIPRQPLAPVIYSAIGVLAVLALIVYVLRPAVRWVTQRQALARIEETYPGSHDDLRNALQLDAETLGARQPARRGARLGAGVAPGGSLVRRPASARGPSCAAVVCTAWPGASCWCWPRLGSVVCSPAPWTNRGAC